MTPPPVSPQDREESTPSRSILSRANAPCLGTLTTDTTSKLDILWHNSHTLSMNSTQVGILKKTNKVRLTRLLQRQDGGRLETQIGLEILSNLTHKTLEGGLTDQKISRLLILANLTKSDSTGTVTVGLLDTPGGGGGLACGLGG